MNLDFLFPWSQADSSLALIGRVRYSKGFSAERDNRGRRIRFQNGTAALYPEMTWSDRFSVHGTFNGQKVDVAFQAKSNDQENSGWYSNTVIFSFADAYVNVIGRGVALGPRTVGMSSGSGVTSVASGTSSDGATLANPVKILLEKLFA